jgi:sulfate transport system permease protein
LLVIQRRHGRRDGSALPDPPLFRAAMIGATALILGVLLFLPLALVFSHAFAGGLGAYWQALRHPDTLSALRLTLLAAAISLPLNALFGLAAAWAITKFDFRFKGLVLTLLDLPFAVSPVVAGLVLTLIYGSRGWLGPSFEEMGVRVLFTPIAVVLATLFVTFPFVVRELIPVMEMHGRSEEEAATVLGANFLSTFWHITLPNVRWGLLYGMLLCNARAMGEFGAVSVVSGHLRGSTITLPLHVELLYNEYDLVAAFAAASLLTLLGLVTLLLKTLIEMRSEKH